MTRADEIFDAFLAREDDVDIDTLCGEHPEHADELRQLHGRWFSLSGLVDALGSTDGGRVDVDGSGPPVDLDPDRYRVGEPIGRGGMGVVLEAWDESMHRHVAVKVARSTAAAGPGAARFLEEARVTGRIDHPGIVPVHELGRDANGRPFFTMKLLRGGKTLDEVFEHARAGEEGWTRERALDAIMRVCDAMAFAHSRGVLHRDLKPRNVMVGRFGETYVVDWGLAKSMGAEDTGAENTGAESTDADEADAPRESSTHDEPDGLDAVRTHEGTVLGTPAYMPPEQADGTELTPRSDVYSVGAILYHYLAGHSPFVEPGENLSASEIVDRLRVGPPTPLARCAPDAPPELVAIAERAMAREPAERYDDMVAMANDLRAFVDGRVVRAHRTGALVELRKWIARNRATAATAFVSLLAIVAISTGSAWLLKDKNDELEGLVTSLTTTQGDLERKTAEAEAERASVLRLAALREIDDLEIAADALWPPHPERRDDFRAWLAEADRLLAGLSSFEARLVGLRESARPADGTREASVTSPDGRRLASLLGERDALRRAIEARDGVASAEPASLDAIRPPSDAETLRRMAWQLAGSDRTVFGLEARGLAYAELAVAAAGTSDLEPVCRRILANALLAVGRVDEALETMAEACADLRVDPDEGTAALAAFEERALSLDERLSDLEAECDALEAVVGSVRDWTFDSPEDTWLHEQLEAVVARLADLERLARGEPTRRAGWSVTTRLREAERLASLAETDPLWTARWDDAIRAIAASPKYDGLEIVPEPDLVPLGADPASGWHEFALLSGGSTPRRGSDGTLVIEEDTAVVFVLLPKSESMVGTQATAPTGQHFDARGLGPEAPPHLVRLSAMLVSKFEMTQSQWLALAGSNPSAAAIGGGTQNAWITGRHPVTNVAWFEARSTLERFAMRLPTEAEWEVAARAGSATPWSSGPDAASLAGHANLADATVVEALGEVPAWIIERNHRDGAIIHAPVGSYLPNDFGLFDVHGNVAELCADAWQKHAYVERSIDDPVVHPVGSEARIARGGAYNTDAAASRSGCRIAADPEGSNAALGVRPARSVRTR